MEKGKNKVMVKLKHEQQKKDEPPKLHTDLLALPEQNIVCTSD